MNSSNVVLRAGPRFASASLLAAALLVGSIAPAQAAPAFVLSASASTVQQSQAFTLSVLADDLTDLFGYQFSVNFDPTLYQVTSVNAGSFLSAAGSTFHSPGTIDNEAGSVSFIFETVVGAVSGVSGSGLLGTINFSALATAAGTGNISLIEVGAVNSALEDIALPPVGAAVVSVVPEPAALALMSLGLAGVLGWRRQSSLRIHRT